MELNSPYAVREQIGLVTVVCSDRGFQDFRDLTTLYRKPISMLTLSHSALPPPTSEIVI